MIPMRSLLTPLTVRLSSFAARVPSLLRHLWLAIVLHALAELCFAPLHELVHWPAAVMVALLLSLLGWVVPRARPRVLARVGEALVAAGAAIAVGFVLVACARSMAVAEFTAALWRPAAVAPAEAVLAAGEQR